MEAKKEDGSSAELLASEFPLKPVISFVNHKPSHLELPDASISLKKRTPKCAHDFAQQSYANCFVLAMNNVAAIDLMSQF